MTTAEARDIQNRLRSLVERRNGPELSDVRYVAGVDVSIRGPWAAAAVPILRFDDLQIVDLAVARRRVGFPYVPGLLSFREVPPILAAVRQLSVEPDVLLVDAQGIAHPRRIGLASHLGVLLDKPTVGCAKSRLIGVHDEPWPEAGYFSDLRDGGELIGAVLRTRTNVKPVYVSIGHKVDLVTAVQIVWQACVGYRLPEPLRKAHQAAGGALRRDGWRP